VYSIAALLKKDGQKIWNDLEAQCQLIGVRRSAIPHFSWQTAESYDFEPLREKLDSLSRNITPFKVHTSGMGIFPGERKILFLIITKDRQLMDLHQMIWETTLPFASHSSDHYSPKNWVPHISLNINNLTPDSFNCAVNDLTSKSLEFEFEIAEIGLLFLTLESSGADAVFKLHSIKGQQ
jgi:2'-5' RNA ligase